MRGLWEDTPDRYFKDDLTDIDIDAKHDIIKIYEFDTLVWERDYYTEEATDLTVAEIEKLLGKRIKIIKEEE